MKFCEVSLTALVVTHTHVTSPRTGQDGAVEQSETLRHQKCHAGTWRCSGWRTHGMVAAARVDKY